MKIIVFDLGGTLMEYRGMPLNWSAYYEQGFRQIAKRFSGSVTQEQLNESAAVMRSWNPRIFPREKEIDPRLIFEQALAGWGISVPLDQAIQAFFDGLDLRAEIYPDVLPVLRALRNAGWTIAALTDLPTAMPDALFRQHIRELLPHLDCCVSSASCGFRKPNPAGLCQIAAKYSTPAQELIFAGDEDKDALTARNAGCRFVRIDRQNGKWDAAIQEIIGIRTMK